MTKKTMSITIAVAVGRAFATQDSPDLFCDRYPQSPFCVTGRVSCQVCHDSAGPPLLNPYGDALLAEVGSADLASALAAALRSVEPLDSDGDGVDNLGEIEAGTWPGFATGAETACNTQVETENAWYTVGRWDPSFAFRRVSIDFCGRQPTWPEWEAFRASPDPTAAVVEHLDACLDSPSWHVALTEVAMPVVRPAEEFNPYNYDRADANPDWDFHFWRYVLTDGRDAADLLQGKYFVVEEPPGSGTLLAVDDPRTDDEWNQQPMEAEHRFGLITHHHSLVRFLGVRFVPRTLVNQFYRELLGLDLARGEGLYPVDEMNGAYPWPTSLDVDDANVQQEGCASCHSTLDPLSYPWARYNGLGGPRTGTYDPDRATDILPTTDGHIFGIPVSGPEEWVAEAVASDHFSRRMVFVFWRHLFQREPLSCEEEAFDALWTDFRDHGRDIERMLHQLVLLDAYGAP